MRVNPPPRVQMQEAYSKGEARRAVAGRGHITGEAGDHELRLS